MPFNDRFNQLEFIVFFGNIGDAFAIANIPSINVVYACLKGTTAGNLVYACITGATAGNVGASGTTAGNACSGTINVMPGSELILVCNYYGKSNLASLSQMPI